jgi:Tol biopolymer transport system component
MVFMGWKDNKGNLYIKDLRGGPALLQRTFRDDIQDVAFSADGARLAFGDYRESNWNIYMVGSEEGAAVRQLTSSTIDERWPVFPPAGSAIYYVQEEVEAVSGRATERSSIWSSDLNTGTVIQYAAGKCPSFTPDGKKAAVTRRNPETRLDEVWLIDFEKGQEVLVLSAKGRTYYYPTISPEGSRIAFATVSPGSASTPANLDIYTVMMDGTQQTQLTFHLGHDICPQWSPDGKSIYVLSQRGNVAGNWNVWRMDLKAGN